MKLKVGDRVAILADRNIAPLGAPVPTGTVTKVGRKYVTVTRDRAVMGGGRGQSFATAAYVLTFPLSSAESMIEVL